jgi:hypothetical protein
MNLAETLDERCAVEKNRVGSEKDKLFPRWSCSGGFQI